jgi:anti-anti-sigma regulatory factor
MHSSPPPVTGIGEVFSWTMEPDPIGAGRTVVALRGEINENADFEPLKQRLAGEVVLDLEGVTRVNSCGVREWVNFVRRLDNVTALWFARCSPNVVLQLNTIYNFRGRARVISFLAPYVCETCHVDEYKVLSVDEHFPDRRPTTPPPAFRCQRCGGVLVFDELPERYLSFLAEEAK